ncbi:glutamine--fructose-6-phosphate transaminase (isomerizing) [Chloroflexota bacterium]
MCGIAGFIGNEDAAPIVLDALKRLEYRGYDSAGLATCADGQIFLKKETGNVNEVNQLLSLGTLPGSVSIGHVRWATHGIVNQHNAHPHIDCKLQVAVVHNGIIENYQELRERLKFRHRFISDTDTEVIAHLIEEHIEAGASLEQAVLQTVKVLKGSYALAVISANKPQKIVGARKDSPLMVGIDSRGNFIASDALCFLQYTNRVIAVEDDEIVVLKADEVHFFDLDGEEVIRESTELEWQYHEATKQKHDFFTIKEIMEQPTAIHAASVQDRHNLTDIATAILLSKQVVITACGTSRYAGVIGRYIFSKLGGKFSDVIIGSEFHYFAESIDKSTLVVAISQSGETADVIKGVKAARKRGATIFSIVNVANSSLARMSDKVLYLNCGPEIGVAATKSFTNQLILLYLVGFAMQKKLDSGINKIEAISHLIEDNLQHNRENIRALAYELQEKKDFYYIARGINFAIAGEGALKLKEISYVHAEGMPAGELKHGTLSLIEKGTPVVAICPSDYTLHETLANISEVKSRGAFVLGISDQNNPVFDEWIKIPSVEEMFYPLVSIMPLQLLAYYSALARNLDPDRPRNLAKSVTVT